MLYNDLTRKKEPFVPLKEGEVSFYSCGPTVYDYFHIGNARPFIVFDVLRRWLEHLGYKVTFVQNFTDIDDKMIHRAHREGTTVPELAERFIAEYRKDAKALGIRPPTVAPRATENVPEIIATIQRIMDNGHAYVSSGDVYFDVRSWPKYGTLCRQGLDDLEAGARVEVGEKKRDPLDFALWKAAKPTEPADAAWDAPWGRGRPGWHLECSAMSRRYLGETFDIHGGGIDLRFPHHENEQAQSHGAGWGFARHWVHNAWVTIKGEKMSKSLGNSLVVAELLKRYDAAVLRLALGTVHHRSTVEFSEETLADAAALWERLSGAILRAYEFCDGEDANPVDAPAEQVRARALPAEFTAAMDEDLNLAGAMAVVHATLKALNVALSRVDAVDKEIRGGEVKPLGETHVAAGRNLGDTVTGLALDLRAQLDVLGLDPLAEPWRSHLLGGVSSSGNRNDTEILNRLLDMERSERDELRAAKDWPRADAQRNKLARAGIGVEDTPSGSRMRRL